MNVPQSGRENAWRHRSPRGDRAAVGIVRGLARLSVASAIFTGAMPRAESSTIRARRHITTDPDDLRTIRNNRRPSSGSISRTRTPLRHPTIIPTTKRDPPQLARREPGQPSRSGTVPVTALSRIRR